MTRPAVLKNPLTLPCMCMAGFHFPKGKLPDNWKKHSRFIKKVRDLFGQLPALLTGILLLLLFNSGCQRETEPIMETEGYIVGGYYCLRNTTISTPYGSGRTYLVETISSDPDSLLVFGVPVHLFDFPDEWLGYYSFPEEQKRTYKLKFRYRNVIRPRDDNLFSFICTLELPDIAYHYPNVVVISARRLD